MSDEIRCQFCQADPFEYVTVGESKVPVAVTCCNNNISEYYQKLTQLSSVAGSNLLKLGGVED